MPRSTLLHTAHQHPSSPLERVLAEVLGRYVVVREVVPSWKGIGNGFKDDRFERTANIVVAHKHIGSVVVGHESCVTTYCSFMVSMKDTNTEMTTG